MDYTTEANWFSFEAGTIYGASGRTDYRSVSVADALNRAAELLNKAETKDQCIEWLRAWSQEIRKIGGAEIDQ